MFLQASLSAGWHSTKAFTIFLSTPREGRGMRWMEGWHWALKTGLLQHQAGVSQGRLWASLLIPPPSGPASIDSCPSPATPPVDFTWLAAHVPFWDPYKVLDSSQLTPKSLSCSGSPCLHHRRVAPHVDRVKWSPEVVRRKTLVADHTGLPSLEGKGIWARTWTGTCICPVFLCNLNLRNITTSLCSLLLLLVYFL